MIMTVVGRAGSVPPVRPDNRQLEGSPSRPHLRLAAPLLRDGVPVRPGLARQLADVDIDAQPVPERLQHVKDEPLAAVEEPEPDHVTIDEVEARPDEQRQPPPARLEPVDALVRTPEEASPTAPFATLAQLLNRLQSGIAVVLVNPGADGRLIPVVLDQV